MYYYIVNPTAGNGAIRGLQEKLRARLGELGISGEWAKTTAPGEATKMAQEAVANGHTTIVAVGGDDTVNEVINGIAKENVAVGIIPVGNGNRIAGRLGITSWQQACEVLAGRRLTSYNLIAAGQKYFLSTLTLGFETDVDKHVDTPQEGLRGRVSTMRQSLGHARHYEPLKCSIVADDNLKLKASTFSLSVSNQKFDNPLAENQLVVSMSDRPKGRHLGAYIWNRTNGKAAIEDVITTRFLAGRVVIETTPATGIMVDGKVAGRTPIAIRLTDRRVKFITEKAAGFHA
jgi:diacylglycerol kinase family enzyme